MIKLPKEAKDQMISSIQAYFEMERDETIGELGAEMLVDFFVKEMGLYYYNQGVADAKLMVEQRWSAVEEDLESLKRSTR
ncbi:DUF2164 domain-containing protein [Bacillus tianshenii]|uniref:DUF2164 domain-containing protein n=1 Tax=Sutcliffiella tianshenii TaxID=1463404 RepID=UPI001CD1EA6B|nr:DUF2164 domain-containing protein [Bacillus tianshenii]MCA1319304.1 DUF2164 domain-containing protein [Bacillus tianshenii]